MGNDGRSRANGNERGESHFSCVDDETLGNNEPVNRDGEVGRTNV